MDNKEKRIEQIEDKLKALREKHILFSKAIEGLNEELIKLSVYSANSSTSGKDIKSKSMPYNIPKKKASKPRKMFTIKPDLERLIGERLISKIGIVLTIIGVIIGVKYSIDHELISPIFRVLLGYICGGFLLFFSRRLKEAHFNYSAVLLSGALSITYFVTYAAYTFYMLFPQALAFIIMLLITLYTVYQAIAYKREIIAQVGLVGAYAIPFLIGGQSDNYLILMSYIAIINIGILVLSFYRNWKSLTFSSFGFTWLIYLFSLWDVSSKAEEFGLALSFSIVFFTTFYSIILCYKLMQKKVITTADVFLLLANSFLFYATSYLLFSRNDIGFLGVLTFAHALIHAAIALFIYKIHHTEQKLFYFLLGLALVFITMAIPVQLDGNWVTILWCLEAVLLFWIGRKVDHFYFESLAYPVLILSFYSLMIDWKAYYTSVTFQSIFNEYFLGSMMAIFSYGYLLFINSKKPHIKGNLLSWHPGVNIGLGALFLITMFCSFYHEISHYWTEIHHQSTMINGQKILSKNDDLIYFKNIWLINYTVVFTILMTIVNFRFINHHLLFKASTTLSLFLLFLFCFKSLPLFGELRDSFLSPPQSELYQHGWFNIGIRYLSIAIIIVLYIVNYIGSSKIFQANAWRHYFDYTLHFFSIWILSSELINLFILNQVENSTKIGLSILWSSYSLFLIILGIIKAKKYLRIMAIGLFTITLIKLFLYDISHLDSLRKTIVFFILGILLLISSYFYNRNKEKLFNQG